MLSYAKSIGVWIFATAIGLLAWGFGRNLEYEYAVVLSWLSVLGLPLLAYLPGDQENFTNFSWRGFLLLTILPGLAIVPGWLMFRFGLCSCVEMGFLFWMVLLVMPACWLGTAGYLWIRRLRVHGRAHWVVLSLLLIMAAVSAGVLWFFPQKRTISVVFGFLHGPIYDRLIQVDAGVLLGRAGHGVLALTLILIALGGIRWRSRRCLALLALALALRVASWQNLSGGHGFDAIQRHLNKVVKADGVVLHYVGKSVEDDDVARSLARDAEFDVQEIKKWIGAKFDDPIHIYAYRDADQKKLLFGGGETDITDVFTPSVHIELGRSPHPTLRHELVHAVASYIGWHGLGFHPNMMVTEGLAMALAPVDQELDLDQLAAGVLKSGRLTSLEGLLSPAGFWSESGSRSYILAGSLIRWIQNAYGASAVSDIYRGWSAPGGGGKSLEEMVEGWKNFVLKSYSSRDDMVVERIARDPGVLGDKCPHSLEDLLRPRADGIFVRLRQPLGWDPDGALTWALGVFPESRQYQLRKFSNDLKIRFESGTMSAGTFDVMIEVAENGRHWPPLVTEDVEMMMIQSDLELIAGRFEDSEKRLQDLKQAFLSKNPGSQIRRQVEVRQAIDRELVPHDRGAWRRYLAGWGSIPGRQDSSSWIVNYLYAKRIKYPTNQDLEVWSRSLYNISQYPEIQKEWIRLSANGYSEMGEFQKAAQLFGDLARFSRGESALLARQNVRRMDFFRYSAKN